MFSTASLLLLSKLCSVFYLISAVMWSDGKHSVYQLSELFSIFYLISADVVWWKAFNQPPLGTVLYILSDLSSHVVWWEAFNWPTLRSVLYILSDISRCRLVRSIQSTSYQNCSLYFIWSQQWCRRVGIDSSSDLQLLPSIFYVHWECSKGYNNDFYH